LLIPTSKVYLEGNPSWVVLRRLREAVKPIPQAPLSTPPLTPSSISQ